MIELTPNFMQAKHYKNWLLITLICLLAACSNNKAQVDASVTAEKLYERAISALESSAFERAITLLQALEAQYPFEGFAEQAQLELIYAYYRNRDYDAANSTAERFIRLRPDHSNVDYAYYMKGLIAFTEETSILDSIIPTDNTLRDPGSARESYSHFAELLTLFPDSIYAADSRQRVIFLRNLIARSEINVANYYFKRGAFVAATSRGRYVVENFQGSPSVPDGLAVMAQGYLLLGYEEQAENAITVLRENYPEHPALDDQGNFKQRNVLSGEKRSVINLMSFGLLDKPKPLGYDTRKLYNSQYSKPPRK